MPARRPVPAVLAALLLGACSTTATSFEEADQAFRSGNYQRAWTLYEAAGNPDANPALAARLARTRWFLIEQELRDELSSGRGELALRLIGQVQEQVPADRRNELAVLKARAQERIGSRHVALGLALIEEDQSAEALRELTLAVAWNPADERAVAALAKLSARLKREERLGDAFYFEGMDNLRTGYELRARASFHHASGLLGEDSRAQERWQAITEDMAETSRSEGRAYLQAGLLGPAFLSIRTAERLEPENPATAELSRELDAKVRSDRALAGADLAIRGGKPDEAKEYLLEVDSFGIEAHSRAARELAQRNLELELGQQYRLGRAFELDEQVLHAASIYRELIAQAAGFGWEDAELRLANLEQRAAQAERSYARALAAEAAGNAADYRAALEETVRLASDYQDALPRLAAARGVPR